MRSLSNEDIKFREIYEQAELNDFLLKNEKDNIRRPIDAS